MNFKNIFKLSALSLAIFTLTGCNNEVEYDAASQMTNAQVYFATDATSNVDLELDQSSFTVNVSRINKSGTLTVDLTSYATVGGEDTDIFNIPASVTFADGADTAPIEVTFDFNDIAPDTSYSITLDLEGDEVTPYGKTEQEVSVIYAPWSKWELLTDYCTVNFPTPFGIAGYAYIQERHSLLNSDLTEYNIPDLFDEGMGYQFQVDASTNYVRVPVQSTGISNSQGLIQFCDTYTFYTEVARLQEGQTIDDFVAKSTFNPETGFVSANVVYFIIIGNQIGTFGQDGYDYIQLPGYADYNVYMSSEGTYISENDEEYTIVKAEMGNDVASYAITLKEGYLDEEGVEAVVKALTEDPETTLYNESQEFRFPVYSDNYYTCVTVNYNSESEIVGSSVYRFYNEIMGYDWNAGWTVVNKNALFYDVFFAGYLWNDVYSWEVEVQQSDDYPGYYRIVKPYANNIYGESVERGHFYIYVDATNPNSVIVYPSAVSLTDYQYYVASSMTMPGKVVGSKIVFPANSLGLVTGLNATGTSWTIQSFWDQEATLLDLNPSTEAETPAAAPRKLNSRSAKARKALKNTMMPFKGKITGKAEKKLVMVDKKF